MEHAFGQLIKKKSNMPVHRMRVHLRGCLSSSCDSVVVSAGRIYFAAVAPKDKLHWLGMLLCLLPPAPLEDYRKAPATRRGE